ncbi:hypothetical protein HPB50_001002 [Hyalomma asiaticum]|uniref:Uncharacterized protein n=1 Tax=Hyalomma asiaticum TaxID=266040 RepID=A0ACB7SJB8_HYAAI|nr:hypothetical protein HPB50_001002 [Hyalomma asiaticum]
MGLNRVRANAQNGLPNRVSVVGLVSHVGRHAPAACRATAAVTGGRHGRQAARVGQLHAEASAPYVSQARKRAGPGPAANAFRRRRNADFLEAAGVFAAARTPNVLARPRLAGGEGGTTPRSPRGPFVVEHRKEPRFCG